MSDFVKNIFWKIIPKKIYALVGPPGTGKSFRAFLVADKYNIKYIIDDGLLIKDQQILAGKSAKEELYHVSAVKCAIFADMKHAREVRKALNAQHFTSLLILGTSENMVNKIAKRLHLPKISKIIRIEDVASVDEIRAAQKSRLDGKHVIPIPIMEVKKVYPNLVLHAIHMFVDEPKGLIFKRNKKRMIEKTIVRPGFGDEGKISISETALLQMVSHCIEEYSEKIKLHKVQVIESNDGFSLILSINVNYSMNTPEKISKVQKIVKDKIEQFTGIPIKKVDIKIVDVYN